MDAQLKTDGLYFFKRNPLFAPLGEEALLALVAALKPLHLEKDVTLIKEGDAGDGLYLIRSGRVHIASAQQPHGEKPMAYLGRGDMLGELTILTGEPYLYNVITDTPCDFLVLAKPNFDAILESHPVVGVHLSRALSKRLAVSFQPPPPKPKAPELFALVPALPHEAMLLFTVNLAMACVEQTRRRVLLLDLSWRSGDAARSLGLHSLDSEMALQEEALLDFDILRRMINAHPSGLEILSLNAVQMKNRLIDALPPLLSMLKDHYDITLVLVPPEKDPLLKTLVREADRILFVTWDQSKDMAENARSALEDAKTQSITPIWKIAMQNPAALLNETVDFLVPWNEMLHQTFRTTGSPYLPHEQFPTAQAGIDRVARAMGRMRVGLAMGSGGAYGYALVGILQVLEREKIPVDLVAGTSMGALLGSFLCAGKSPSEIREISKTITKRWLFERMFKDLSVPHGGFLAGHSLIQFLKSILGEVEFHQLQIPFAAVATDIRSGHEVVLRDGRVADAVRASTSLPIIFEPHLLKGRFLVDGGLTNPVPTSVVANMGADILISINLTAKPSVRRGLGRYRPLPLEPPSPRITEVFFKMLYTMQYEIAQARTEIAHVVIAPDIRDYLWTDFHRSEDILKYGVAGAEEALARIKSLLPCFSDNCQIPPDSQHKRY